MGQLTPLEERACRAYIRAMYADQGSCSDICQLYSDGRKEKAEELLNAQGSGKADKSLLWSVMSTAPVLNGGTAFTSLMSAERGEYETVVRRTSSTIDPATMDALRFLMHALVPALSQDGHL